MELGFYQLDAVGRRCYAPPFPLPHVRIDDVYEAVRSAQMALARLDRAMDTIDGINATGLLVRLEAVESSAAEGTTSTFTELAAHEATLGVERVYAHAGKRTDVESVMAVVDAFPETTGPDSKPISPIRRAKMIHGLLFPHEAKGAWSGYPLGGFKRFPNATTDEDQPGGLFHYARPDRVQELMLQWQDQTVGRNEAAPVEPLIRQALSHWLFEHIHPFADGNGRVGRLLTPIMLWRQGSSAYPCGFYGEPVRANKTEYIDALKTARQTGDLGIWVRYFCFLLSVGAEQNHKRIEALSGLLLRWRRQLAAFRSDSLVHELMPFVTMHPVVTLKTVMKRFPNRSFNTANTAVAALAELGILALAGEGARNRLFMNSAVLDLFDTRRAGRKNV
jgi:Fic family protein